MAVIAAANRHEVFATFDARARRARISAAGVMHAAAPNNNAAPMRAIEDCLDIVVFSLWM